MAENLYDARAYEERYRKAYEARAEFWEKPISTEALVKFLSDSNMPKGLTSINIGCTRGVLIARKSVEGKVLSH